MRQQRRRLQPGTGTFMAASAYFGYDVRQDTAMKKEKLFEAVRDLPNDFELEDLFERLGSVNK